MPQRTKSWPVILLVIFLLLMSVTYRMCRMVKTTIKTFPHSRLSDNDVKLYDNTKAWPLAQAVDKEDTSQIKTIIAADSSLMNFQDPIIHMSLLNWAIHNKKIQAAKILAQLGASADIMCDQGWTALTEAVKMQEQSHIDILELLIRQGANVNAINIPRDPLDFDTILI